MENNGTKKERLTITITCLEKEFYETLARESKKYDMTNICKILLDYGRFMAFSKDNINENLSNLNFFLEHLPRLDFGQKLLSITKLNKLKGGVNKKDEK